MKTPARNRQRTSRVLANIRHAAYLRRRDQWSQWLTLLSMAVLLTCTACAKKLTPTTDREHPNPMVVLKGGVQI